MWQYRCRSMKVGLNTEALAPIFSSRRMLGWVAHQHYFHSEQRKPSRRWCSPQCCQHADLKIDITDLYQHTGYHYGHLLPPGTSGICQCSLFPGYQICILLLPNETERSQNHTRKETHLIPGEKVRTAPDMMVMWTWNWTNQVKVVLGNLLLLNFDGYGDASSNQPNVQSISCYTRMEMKRCSLADLKDGHKAWGLCNPTWSNTYLQNLWPWWHRHNASQNLHWQLAIVVGYSTDPKESSDEGLQWSHFL